MPNWSFATYRFKASEEQTKNLNQKLEDLSKMKEPYVENGFGNLWCGCLVNYLGGDWNKVYCRGEITEFEIGDDGLLLMNLECAWDELPEFRHFIEQQYPGSKIYYINEESGMGIYTTNDKDGLYFRERYLLDMYDDIEYFETLETAAKYVSERIGKQVKPDVKDIQAACDEYYEGHDEDENFFMSFHEFKILGD